MTSPHEPSITMVVAQDPKTNGDGTVTIVYEISVNYGGEYKVDNRVAFTPGVVVVSASSTDVSTGESRDHRLDLPDLRITPGYASGDHTYQLSVTVDTKAVRGAAARDCTLDSGETGTGLLNRAMAIVFRGASGPEVEACAPIPN